MQKMLEINPKIFPLSIILAIVAFIIWVIIHRIKLKSSNNEIRQSYTGLQILGMIGIVVFMAPLFFVIVSSVAQGCLFILFFLFSLVPFPEIVKLIFQFTTYSIMTFCIFSGTYYLCEKIWPKRSVLNE